MPKRFTAPRSEAREFATTTNPPTVARDAASSTAIDINREPSDEPDHRGDRSGPNEEEIRRRAYQRYLERGGVNGSDFDDWLEAERELRNGKAEVRS
jgi:hypothetical protein